MVAGGMVVLAASILPIEALAPLSQPVALAIVFLLAGFAVAGFMWYARRATDAVTTQAAVLALAGFAGLAFTGVVINSWLKHANDLTGTIARLKADLPTPEELISFGAIDHRFAFYYETFIPEHRWPLSVDDVDNDVHYFCVNRNRTDAPEIRRDGHGFSGYCTPKTLPLCGKKSQ